MISMSIKKITLTAITLAITIARVGTADAADGDLNTAFSSDGKTRYSFAASNSAAEASAIAIQADGKVLVGGYHFTFTTIGYDVMRYNTNGTLDTTFAGTGRYTVEEDSAVSTIKKKFFLQPDNKILFIQSYSAIRLTDAGVLDSSYGTNGVLRFGLSCNYAMQDAFGRLVIFDGSLKSQRYEINGVLDTTYGVNGTLSLTKVFNTETISAVYPSGKIVSHNTVYSGGSGIAVHNPDGTLDASFGVNGIATSDSIQGLTFHTARLQPDGKILIASANTADLTVVRLNTDGALDSSFGNNGIATLPWTAGNGTERPYNVLLQPDGKVIILAGENITSNGTAENFLVWRLTSAGITDTTFSGDGVLAIDFGFTNHETASNGAFDAAGNLFVVGKGFSTASIIAATTPFDTSINTELAYSNIVNVELNTLIESAPMIMNGLGSNITVPIRVQDGEYSIDNGPYTSEQGFVKNGASIKLRGRSSSSYNAASQVMAFMGGISVPDNNYTNPIGMINKEFITTTRLLDSTPDAFNFTSKINVALSTIITSSEVTVSGFDNSIMISIDHGEYSINGGAFTSESGFINSGDRIQVRHTSSALYIASVESTIIIGGVSGVFTTTTPPEGTPPVDGGGDTSSGSNTSSGGGGALSWFFALFLPAVLLLRRVRK